MVAPSGSSYPHVHDVVRGQRVTGRLVRTLTWVRRNPYPAALVAVAFWVVGAVVVDAVVDGMPEQFAAFVSGILGLPLTGVVVVVVLGHLDDESWKAVVEARRRNALKATAT